VIDFVNILVAGIAYGVLLFLMAGGLSVTMGLMGFANLAHGALAMLGGYIVVMLMNWYGWPFFGALPMAAIKGYSWQSPAGPISIDPKTRDNVRNIYIRKVVKENGVLFNKEFQTFPAVHDQWHELHPAS